MNNVIFNNQKCNPVDVIDQAGRLFMLLLLYSKGANLLQDMLKYTNPKSAPFTRPVSHA